MLLKCAICSPKKSRLIKKQKGSGILSSFSFKTPFSTIPLFCEILF